MLIKTIRKFFMNAYVAIPLLLVFVATSYNSFANSMKLQRVNYFSGEEIFKGVFFLEGEYTELIPELASLKHSYLYQNMNFERQQNFEEEKARIINSIKERDPEFFTNLKNAVKSGDRILVAEALENATDLIKSTLYEESSLTEEDIISLKEELKGLHQNGERINLEDIENDISSNAKLNAIAQAEGHCGAIAVVLVGALAVGLVVAFWIAIYLDYTDGEPTTASIENSSLFKEQMINSISETASVIG